MPLGVAPNLGTNCGMPVGRHDVVIVGLCSCVCAVSPATVSGTDAIGSGARTS